MGISDTAANAILPERIRNQRNSNIQYAITIKSVTFIIWEETKHQRCRIGIDSIKHAKKDQFSKG